jgi:hypothetical protein
VCHLGRVVLEKYNDNSYSAVLHRASHGVHVTAKSWTFVAVCILSAQTCFKPEDRYLPNLRDVGDTYVPLSPQRFIVDIVFCSLKAVFTFHTVVHDHLDRRTNIQVPDRSR